MTSEEGRYKETAGEIRQTVRHEGIRAYIEVCQLIYGRHRVDTAVGLYERIMNLGLAGERPKRTGGSRATSQTILDNVRRIWGILGSRLAPNYSQQSSHLPTKSSERDEAGSDRHLGTGKTYDCEIYWSYSKCSACRQRRRVWLGYTEA